MHKQKVIEGSLLHTNHVGFLCIAVKMDHVMCMSEVQPCLGLHYLLQRCQFCIQEFYILILMEERNAENNSAADVRTYRKQRLAIGRYVRQADRVSLPRTVARCTILNHANSNPFHSWQHFLGLLLLPMSWTSVVTLSRRRNVLVQYLYFTIQCNQKSNNALRRRVVFLMKELNFACVCVCV